MKTTEDIDRRIGMPDVEDEWARFEREVIHRSKVISEQRTVNSEQRSVNSEQRSVNREQRTVNNWHFRLPRTAAVAAVVIGISLTAWASVWIVRTVIPARRASSLSADSVRGRDTLSATVAPADTLGLFVFENVDMQTIAQTLGEHYGVEPVFRDETLKSVRLYARFEKTKSLDEVVALLNHFKKVRLSVTDGKLIVDGRKEKD